MMRDLNSERLQISITEFSQLLARTHELLRQTQIELDHFSESVSLPINRDGAVETAKRIIRLRRKRDKLFAGISPDSIFGEPAWEMLLDLFVATSKGKRVSVSSLCIASIAPTTTALRYITVMTQRGLIVRTPDENDQRRVFITLSDPALEIMNTILGVRY